MENVHDQLSTEKIVSGKAFFRKNNDKSMSLPENYVESDSVQNCAVSSNM